MSPMERFSIFASCLLLALTLLWGGMQMVTERQCLARGWPSAKVDLLLSQYCIKRVDQTDVVVPLKELQ